LSQLLRLRCECDATATAVQRHAACVRFVFTMRLRLPRNCDVTATRNKHVHFSARLHEVAAAHSAGIGVGVVDRL